MKILLDESLPTRLSEYFGKEHIVFSVRDMNWLGKKNGELLRLIVENNFEVFVTADRNLPYQQNIQDISFTIAILRGVDNRQQTYISLIPKLLELLEQMELPKVIEVT
jgi:predicted nuclease of predicted toxin-antitoxin system